MSGNSELLEGDMKLNIKQQSALNGISPKTGLLEMIRRWDKNSEGFVIVAYKLDPSYSKNYLQNYVDLEFKIIHSISSMARRLDVRPISSN